MTKFVYCQFKPPNFFIDFSSLFQESGISNFDNAASS